MDKITVTLTKDQAKHLIDILYDKIKRDGSSYTTRLAIKLHKATYPPKN